MSVAYRKSNKIEHRAWFSPDDYKVLYEATRERARYIFMRLIEGADIYALAKNCRTSVEMIERHYASHIKDLLDTAAINVRKPKPARTGAAKKVVRRRDS